MKPIAKRKVTSKCNSVITYLLFLPMISNAQSDLTAIVKGSEILVGGLITIFSSSKKNPNSPTVESVCVKNKMNDKIKLIITKQSDDGDEIKKELIIQKDSKECFFDLPKGVYTYEIILSNEEIYKKGEYRFKDKTVISLKDDLKEVLKEDVTKEIETKTPIQ